MVEELNALMVSEVDNTEVLPLKIYSVIDNNVSLGKWSQDLNNMETNIDKVAREGGLSPKHAHKLKESHSKRKKKGIDGYLAELSHSRQTKSTTNKGNNSTL